MNSTKITTKINKSQLFYGYRRQKQEIAELKKRLKKKDEFWLKSMANVFKLEKEIKHKNKLFEKWGEENKKLKELNIKLGERNKEYDAKIEEIGNACLKGRYVIEYQQKIIGYLEEENEKLKQNNPKKR